MVPSESLSQYLSKEYQCYRLLSSRNITNIFLHSDFGDKSRPQSQRAQTHLGGSRVTFTAILDS
jgi:hypothetical protein